MCLPNQNADSVRDYAIKMDAPMATAGPSLLLAMPLLLFAFVALVQPVQQGVPTRPTTPVQAATPALAAPPAPAAFTVAPTVLETQRIELTPKIDGKIEEEEWDPFTVSGSLKTFFQWEPGVIYAAATGPAGQDMILSLDLNSDGWLVGDDNLEARVTTSNGKAQVTVRRLDASNVAGPVWRELPGFVMASECAASTDGGNVTYELRLVDPGLEMIPDKASKISARIDLVPATDAPSEAYLPRSLASVDLVSTRAAALPAGLRWGVEHANRSVTPGDAAFIRLTFNSKPPVPLKKIELRSEGQARDVTNQVTVPFPGWDDKGRAFVDYTTRIDPGTETGYRLLHGTLTAGDGAPSVLEASYRIAPPVDFELVRKGIGPDVHDRSLVFGYYLTSNTERLVTGEAEITVPSPLKLVNGGQVQKFRIVERRGRLRNTFELFIPGNSSGTFPLTFKVTGNGQTRTYIRYLIVG